MQIHASVWVSPNLLWQHEKETNRQIKWWFPKGNPRITFPLICIQISKTFQSVCSIYECMLFTVIRLNHYKAVKNTGPEAQIAFAQNSSWKVKIKVDPKKMVYLPFVTPGTDPVRESQRGNRRRTSKPPHVANNQTVWLKLFLTHYHNWLDRQIFWSEKVGCVSVSPQE